MKFDLSIKKKKRSRAKYFCKTPPGTNASKAKAQAIRDISASKFYNRNYIPIEYLVLRMLKEVYLEITQIDYP